MKIEKFRVISDLHLDLNYNQDIGLQKDSVFTVVAGDIAGNKTIVTCKLLTNQNIYSVNYDHSEIINYLRSKNLDREILTYNKKDNCWYSEDNTPLDPKTYRIRVFSRSYLNSLLLNYNENTFSIPDKLKIEIKIFTVDNWLKEHISKGIFIAGNHIGYNFEPYSVSELKRQYAKSFPIDNDISFLDYEHIMLKEFDNVLFIGSTLFTDYKYINAGDIEYFLKNYPKNRIEKEIIDINMSNACRNLNDFYVCVKKYDKKNNSKEYFEPKDYLKIFKKTFSRIKKIVEDNKDKDIVIVSHHCPSSKCIAKNYINNILNASYVSDLDDFILGHPNIKCWVCGHVHHQAYFNVGACLIVMNPYGYSCYKENLDFNPNIFINTKTWQIEKL